MKLFKVLFVLSLLVLLSACSKDDNPTDPGGGSSASILKGSWEIDNTLSSGMILYDIQMSISMDENGGVVTGNGTLDYVNNQDSNSVDISINGDLTGTYSSPNISVTMTDGTTGYSFTYVGKWENSGENFKGTLTVEHNDGVSAHNDIYLYKK